VTLTSDISANVVHSHLFDVNTFKFEEERQRLTSLFHTYDVDNSGQIEKNEFFTICQELWVPSQEAEGIFNRLDVDNDGSVTLEEFISGFSERHDEEEEDSQNEDKNSSKSEEEFPNNDKHLICR
uniref:EF-hand domain-containing protein n=1 Tax=Labrus bergylta TaxID=56723 RepID=A0A3Q3G561_9LABR